MPSRPRSPLPLRLPPFPLMSHHLSPPLLWHLQPLHCYPPHPLFFLPPPHLQPLSLRPVLPVVRPPVTPSSTPLSSVTPSLSTPPVARRPSPTFDAASTWASETDYTYESSILRPSPSVRSIGLPEPGGSFDTSFLHPTDSLVSEPLGPQWVERIVSSPSLSVRSSVLQPPPAVTVSPASSITAVIVS